MATVGVKGLTRYYTVSGKNGPLNMSK